MFDDYKDIVNIDDLCKMLGIGKNAAYVIIKNGSIKSFRVGKVHKIPKAWVIQYINSQVS